jgi:hypothetical protein
LGLLFFRLTSSIYERNCLHLAFSIYQELRACFVATGDLEFVVDAVLKAPLSSVRATLQLFELALQLAQVPCVRACVCVCMCVCVCVCVCVCS